jgi:pimeloyl-ACP methyl ester carboxylesterase
MNRRDSMTTAITSTSGLIDIGTTEQHYEVRGRGPTLLLISSGTGDAGEWRTVGCFLSDGATPQNLMGLPQSPRSAGRFKSGQFEFRGLRDQDSNLEPTVNSLFYS